MTAKNLSCVVLLAPVLAFLSACGTAHLPPEPPTRIRLVERAIPVVLASEPAGAHVFAVDAQGGVGPPLGVTPCEIARVPLVKEVWKYGEGGMPAPVPPPVHVRTIASQHVADIDRGEPLTFAVFLAASPDAAPRRLDLTLPAAGLERAWASGRIELHAP